MLIFWLICSLRVAPFFTFCVSKREVTATEWNQVKQVLLIHSCEFLDKLLLGRFWQEIVSTIAIYSDCITAMHTIYWTIKRQHFVMPKSWSAQRVRLKLPSDEMKMVINKNSKIVFVTFMEPWPVVSYCQRVLTFYVFYVFYGAIINT